MIKQKTKGKMWIISFSDDLKNQRIAYNLKHLAPDKKIINVDNYENIPDIDKNLWQKNKKLYNFISNIQKIPILSNVSFNILNKFQTIKNIYFKKQNQNPDPTFILKQIYELIQKGWGKHLIEFLKNQNKELPIISDLNIPLFMAEYYNYPSKICQIVYRSDIQRSILPLNIIQSKIIYFASTENVAQKLLQYGVLKENIFLTGYPLPKENIGKINQYEIIKKNIKNRILNLAPKKNYSKNFQDLISKNIGRLPKQSNHKLTIMFCAEEIEKQKTIAILMLKNLAYMLQNESINLIISCGLNEENKQFFLKEILKLRLGLNIDKNIFIIYDPLPQKYFKLFNEALNRTDILWTNPNELVFYAALGIPIILSPSKNLNEKINEKWLIENEAGIKQQDPKYTNEWLFDLIREGKLAEMAINGFIKFKKDGLWEIEKIVKLSATF
ncbi:MAG: hypothetical protein RMK17_01570 [bacterium]|nr:hypothetical protein [Patescibacteria group bacterium]MDW8279836.1 hypothetical protein [bacterium]